MQYMYTAYIYTCAIQEQACVSLYAVLIANITAAHTSCMEYILYIHVGPYEQINVCNYVVFWNVGMLYGDNGAAIFLTINNISYIK